MQFNYMNARAIILLIFLSLWSCAENVESPPAPNTIEEAFCALDKLLTPKDRSIFMRKPEAEAVTDAHFGLGLYIRNNWFRHGSSALPGLLHDLGARHLDDVSSIILTAYWRHLNGKPTELEKQGACYKRWWEEQQRLENEAKEQGSESYRYPDFSCP